MTPEEELLTVLSAEKQRLIILAMWDGCGVRAAALAAGVHRDTVSFLIGFAEIKPQLLDHTVNYLEQPIAGRPSSSFEVQCCSFPPPLWNRGLAWLTWRIHESSGLIDGVVLSDERTGAYQAAPFWLSGEQRRTARYCRFRHDHVAVGWLRIAAWGWNTRRVRGGPSPAERACVDVGPDPAAWMVEQLGRTSACGARVRGPVDWMGRPREVFDAP